MYFSRGSWFASVLVLLAIGAVEVRSSWAGGKSCLWDTLQRICFHRLYCIMEVWLLVLGWFVLYKWRHQLYFELCSNFLHLLMHFLCSVLLASSSTHWGCCARWTVGTRSKGSCPSLFPSSRVGLYMKTSFQFALCSSFSSAVPKSCWAAVLCLISQSQTLKSLYG